MTLQERIDFILNKNFPASVKRKHLVHLMQHLGEYSEDADELGEAYDRICTALEQLDNEIDSLNQAHEFKSRKYDKGADGSLTKDLLNSLYGKFNTPQPLTVTELDNERVEQNEFKQFENWLKGNQTPIAPKPLTVTELDRTLEFFLTYSILSMQQVQEIRYKAAAYLR